jgi:hypothetical protein
MELSIVVLRVFTYSPESKKETYWKASVFLTAVDSIRSVSVVLSFKIKERSLHCK